jgi:hypothetical protein
MIDELQRMQEHVAETRAAALKDFSRLAAFAYARTNLADAAERHLPALLRVARAAKQLRKAMTTPPKGYGDEHQGYWWTAATERAAEEVAEAVDELEKP